MGLISFFTWIAFLLCSIHASSEDFADSIEDFIEKKFENEQAQFQFGIPRVQYDNSFPFQRNNFDLGRQIAENVQRQLSPLKNLGALIESQVNEKLKPVKALGIQSSMAKGVGGTTVIVYTSPKPVKMLVRNGETYICTDGKVDDVPTCSSKKLFSVKEKEDYCYSRNVARGNDNFCIANSPNAGLSIVIINDKFICNSDRDHEALVLKISEYEKLCGRDPWDLIFTYYPDHSNPLSIKIPNDNPYVSCTLTTNGGCSFKGDAIFGKNFVSGANNVNIIDID